MIPIFVAAGLGLTVAGLIFNPKKATTTAEPPVESKPPKEATKEPETPPAS